MNFNIFKYRFVRNLTVYTTAVFLNKAIGFILLPVFSHYFSEKEYGLFALYTTILVFLTPVVELSASGAISVEYFKLDDRSKFKHYFSSAILAPLIATTLLTLFMLLFYEPIADWAEIKAIWLVFLPVLTLLQIIPLLLQSYYRVVEKPISFTVFTLLYSIFNILIGLYFVVLLNLNYEGRIASLLINGAVFSLISLFFLWKADLLTFKIKKAYIRDAVAFGLPLLPVAIARISMNMSDRFFIKDLVGIEELGMYNMGYMIGMIINHLGEAITNAWAPYLMNQLKLNTDISRKKIIKGTIGLVTMVCISFITLIAINPLIFTFLIDDKFEAASEFVFWIALGYFFLSVYRIFVNVIFYYKKNHLLLRLALFIMPVNLIMNYFFIHKWGAAGAAYVTVITYFLYSFYTIYHANNLFPIRWAHELSSLTNDKLKHFIKR